MSWVKDHCEKRPPTVTSERRARGILTIHRTCEPPCPRRLGAALHAPLPANPALRVFR